MPIIQGLVLEESTIYSDGWAAYDGLIVNGYDHYRVFQCVAGATQPQRVCQGEEPCERDRELLELCQAQACEIQRLLIRQIRGTLDGVPVEVQPPQ